MTGASLIVQLCCPIGRRMRTTQECWFLDIELRESRLCPRPATRARFTQSLSHKYTPLSTKEVAAADCDIFAVPYIRFHGNQEVFSRQREREWEVVTLLINFSFKVLSYVTTTTLELFHPLAHK